MIYNLSANPKAPVPGWCSQSRGKMADEMGMSRRAIITIVQVLEEKGLVERNESDFLRTTDLWYDAVQGVKKLHTPPCEETAHPVKEVHTPCEETAQERCEETAHKNNNTENNTEKEREPQPVEAKSSEEDAPAAKPSKRKAQKPAELAFPDFATDRFKTVWGQLTRQPKWSTKSANALQLSLNKLARYDEAFSIKLMETTIERNWTGVVFEETDEDYRKYCERKPRIPEEKPQERPPGQETYQELLQPEFRQENQPKPKPVRQFSWMHN
ncbi:hypothetical protein [Larkinella soli]|uniref:hypothetical protein n=1 Tax=Larkinella soli TaxID=1770527 RepID=UPI000FFC7E0A|nr:hypothetical protein [Larkinella soli]